MDRCLLEAVDATQDNSHFAEEQEKAIMSSGSLPPADCNSDTCRADGASILSPVAVRGAKELKIPR